VKHLELDWPLATEPTSEQKHWFRNWSGAVDRAIATNDSSLLAELYAELVGEVEVHNASHIWLSRMSGWDASAVTG
jgi:hypothetical protein